MSVLYIRLERNILTRNKLPDPPPSPQNQMVRRGPDMGCLCLHIKKGEDHFYTFNANFIFAKFWTVLHLSRKGCRLI